MKPKVCIWCQESFTPHNCGTQTSCSPECRAKFLTKKRQEEYTKETGYKQLPTPAAQGAISELRIVNDLMARGYMAFRNCSARGSVDLIGLWPGPNQTPLRFEVKTVRSLEHGIKGHYELGTHFDHWAKITATGQIQYVPELPEQSEGHDEES